MFIQRVEYKFFHYFAKNWKEGGRTIILLKVFAVFFVNWNNIRSFPYLGENTSS